MQGARLASKWCALLEGLASESAATGVYYFRSVRGIILLPLAEPGNDMADLGALV